MRPFFGKRVLTLVAQFRVVFVIILNERPLARVLWQASFFCMSFCLSIFVPSSSSLHQFWTSSLDPLNRPLGAVFCRCPPFCFFLSPLSSTSSPLAFAQIDRAHAKVGHDRAHAKVGQDLEEHCACRSAPSDCLHRRHHPLVYLIHLVLVVLTLPLRPFLRFNVRSQTRPIFKAGSFVAFSSPSRGGAQHNDTFSTLC